VAPPINILGLAEDVFYYIAHEVTYTAEKASRVLV